MMALELIGRTYYEARRHIMQHREEGLTDIYNRLNDPDERSADIQGLRTLQVELDKAVSIAYAWVNLDLGHGFQETAQGVRFTICDSARRATLDHLLALNHQRYAEEVRSGLHVKKGGANAGKGRKLKINSQAKSSQNALFISENPE